jgi:hypothetical protein
MDPVQEAKETLDKIRQEADRQEINLDDSNNTFTVWGLSQNGWVAFCGEAPSFQDAWTIAEQHRGVTNPHILTTEPARFSINRFDPNRETEQFFFPR